MHTYLKKPESQPRLRREGRKTSAPGMTKPLSVPQYCLSEPCIQRKVYIGEDEAQYEDVLGAVVQWCQSSQIVLVSEKVASMMGKFLKMDRLTHDEGELTGVYYFDSMESLLDKIAMEYTSCKVNVGNVGQGDASLLSVRRRDVMIDLGQRSDSVRTAFAQKQVFDRSDASLGALQNRKYQNEAVAGFIEHLGELMDRLDAQIAGCEADERDRVYMTGIVQGYLGVLKEQQSKVQGMAQSAGGLDGAAWLECIRSIGSVHRHFCSNISRYRIKSKGLFSLMWEFSKEYNDFLARHITFADIQAGKNLPLLIEMTRECIAMSQWRVSILWAKDSDSSEYSTDLSSDESSEWSKPEGEETDAAVSLLMDAIGQLGMGEIVTAEQILIYLKGESMYGNLKRWVEENIVTCTDGVIKAVFEILLQQDPGRFVTFTQNEAIKEWMMGYRQNRRGMFASGKKRLCEQGDAWEQGMPVVITHKHEDHTGGRSGLEGRSCVLAADQYSLQENPRCVIENLNEYGLEPVRAGWLDEGAADPNATSLMTYYDRTAYGYQFRVYFLGDSPIARLTAAAFPEPLAVHVLVFPHHGSVTANGSDMPPNLFGTERTYGIISAGAGSSYLLPSCEALLDNRRRGLAAPDGTRITFPTSDGNKVVILRSTMNIGYEGEAVEPVPGYVVFASDSRRGSFYTKAWFRAGSNLAPGTQHAQAEALVIEEQGRKEEQRRQNKKKGQCQSHAETRLPWGEQEYSPGGW